jgi:DNA-binding NtrC family response regulator
VASSTPPAIVIVDDETAYSTVLRQSLSDWLGAPILTYSRPQAALEAMANLEVGVVISDYFMPQMNGLQFLLQVHKLKPNLPCLLITGHGVTLEEPEAEELPELKEVLSKPFSPRVLAAAIRRHWPAVPTVEPTA